MRFFRIFHEIYEKNFPLYFVKKAKETKKEEPPVVKKPAPETKPQQKKEAPKEVAQEIASTATTSNVRPSSAQKKAGKIKTNVVQDQKNAGKVIFTNFLKNYRNFNFKLEGTSGVILDKKMSNDEEDMTIKEAENNANYKAGSNFEGKGKFTKETLKEEKEKLVFFEFLQFFLLKFFIEIFCVFFLFFFVVFFQFFFLVFLRKNLKDFF